MFWKITVLNSVSVSSKSDVSFGFLVNWLISLWTVFFCFVCLIVFYWILAIVNFIMVGAEYFCILINVLDLCFGKQLGFMAIVWLYQDFLLWFIIQNQREITIEQIIFYKTRPFCVLYSISLDLWGFHFWHTYVGTRHWYH